MARIIVYLQVTTKSHMKPRYLSEGEHFGEICLFVSNLKRTASIVATRDGRSGQHGRTAERAPRSGSLRNVRTAARERVLVSTGF